jgi:endonuclease/exonuclease/phosphatase family metal-dependent hydrolase
LRDGRGGSPGGDEQAGGGTRPPDPSPTNWRGWQRGTTKAPTQRLDYVYVSPAIGTCIVQVPQVDAVDLSRFAAISDHLPVTAVLAVRTG